jgi:hypothetical protein
VLYFFSSTAPDALRSTCFTHTLLYQVICCSSGEKTDSIAATFLTTLLGNHFRRRSRGFKAEDTLVLTIKKILDAPDSELIEALAEAIKKSRIQKLTIVMDGFQGTIAYSLVNRLTKAIPVLKALLTRGQISNAKEMLDEMLYIEYDKERRGLYINHFLIKFLAN